MARAERSGADEDRMRRLERFNRLALTAQSMIEYRRDREAELAALVDAAHEFVAARQGKGLLESVARRARLLLKLDVAYVGLHEEDRPGTLVLSADGNAVKVAESYRLPPDGGLGAMVRTCRAPFWTPDYLGDDSFVHVEAIDDIVRAEGLRAVLAVPLSTGGESMGVLYVADRQVRHLTPNEVTLLCSLADLAAVAIEHNRLVEELRDTIGQLRQDVDETRTALARTRKSADLQSHLITQVMDRCGVDSLLATAAEALGGGTGLCSPLGRPLAKYGNLRPLAPADLRAACRRAAETGRPTSVVPGAWTVPLHPGGNAGFLLTDLGPDADHTVLPLLPMVARTLALHLRVQQDDSPEAQSHQEFFDDLIGAPRSPTRLRERALMFSLSFRRPHVVLVAGGPHGASSRLEAAGTDYAKELGGLCSVRDGAVVLLLPGDDPVAVAQTAAPELTDRAGHSVTVGVAGPASTVDGIADAHREAAKCLETLRALGGDGGTACASDLGFLGMLLAEENDVPGYIRTTIGPVVDYDTHRFTDLVPTLRVYLESGRSPTRAAETLRVHPNTVSRRLERIGVLLGEDWQSPDRVLDIQLALRLYQVRSALSSQPASETRAVLGSHLR
ncbi:helix-turn-helix domain-containing protein [Streptomyces caniscabiei]|uniref:Helix-turn-helix domain-containing protein n=1 Tax=Streptomyces caniscabiei TaxID=2746961 RepID=A0A927L686_9ACTN|nr:helix-turn-helix domain-containing protein [Streptomyces caniscabiei]MBD9726845.1 helix-turn-helix domain-containing protein [Streptomyces caniscabiei]MDX3513756.1 helix-turn-helix domain-containing protein [Streptomyces caniscabiei]MDX3722553.1 helix-turn-helix domain-containing protein [Streptomyces caniscabiei]MDX3733044.1 helix-turn-helix domain-containing protein [Streptomyces caniscabiei]WEO23267.1 helix-turn-helix domain-containing protein [Streptomyces caniscabiei]